MLRRLILLLLLSPAALLADDWTDQYPYRDRLGINTGGLAFYSSNVALADAMRMARPFTDMQNNIWSDVDENLYPRSLPEEGLRAIVLNAYFPEGEYVITWEGDAELELLAVDAESTVELITKERNRLVYNVDPEGYIHLYLMDMSRLSPLRDLHVWLPGLEDHWNDWNPAWLREAAPFGVYRFMDKMATNDSRISEWTERPNRELLTYTLPNRVPESFYREGVPAESLIELCNVMQASPWFCMPHLADDDYVRRFAELVKSELSPKLKIYVEYSNEVFNYAFDQATYAINMARERDLDADGAGNHLLKARFYGERSSEVFEIWREVFGAESDRLICVATFGVRREVDVEEARELFTYNDNFKNFDAISFAPYTGVGMGRRFDKPLSEMSIEDLMHQLIREQSTQIKLELERAGAFSEEFGLPLIAYEGGQHLSVFGGGVRPADRQAFGQMVPEANKHKLMEAFYRDHLRDWFDTTGGVYCHFGLIEPPLTNGYSWGLKEYIGQALEEAPKARPFWDLSQHGTGLSPSQKDK